LRGAERRGNLNLFVRDCFAPLGLAMTSEGIFFAPRDDTGIIAFVLILGSSLKHTGSHSPQSYFSFFSFFLFSLFLMAFSFFSLSLLSFSLVVSFTSLPKYVSSYKKSSFFFSTLVGFTYLSTNSLVSFKLSFSKRKENSSSKAEEILFFISRGKE